MIELVARNFECFPKDSAAFEKFGALIALINETRYLVAAGEKNSNQLTYDFDAQIEARLRECGAVEIKLDFPRHIRQKYDFAFSYAGSRVVVEVEKANWEKILRDFLKMHLYFQHGADFGLLFLPKNYPHSHGEPDNFETGIKLYTQCLETGFAQAANLKRILLVGYEQLTENGERFGSAARNLLKAARLREATDLET